MDLRVLLGVLAAVVLAVFLLVPTSETGPEPDAVAPTEVSSEQSVSPETLALIDAIEPPGLSESRTASETVPYSIPCPFFAGPIDPVGTVNGTILSYELFFDAYARLVEQYMASLGVPPEAVETVLAGSQGAELQMGLVRNTFEVLIQNVLFRNELDARGIVMDEQTVDAVFEEQYTNFLNRSQITEQELEGYALSQGSSLEEFRGTYRERAALDLEFKALVSAVSSDLVTERELQAYYNLHPDEFVIPLEVHLFQIVVPTEELAQSLLLSLSEGGSFEDLARENSVHSSATDGGDMGWIRRGEYLDSVEDVAFDLPVGEMSDIVESPYGYHILLVEDRHEPKQLSFEEARETSRDEMVEAVSADVFAAWFEDARADAVVEAFEPVVDAYLSWQNDLDRSLGVVETAIREGASADPYAPYFLGRLYEQKIAALNQQLSVIQEAGPLTDDTLELVTRIMIDIETNRAKAIDAYEEALDEVGEDATIELRIAELEGSSHESEHRG